MNNIKFLEGSRIFLRPLLEEDIKGPYLSWLNDKEVCLGNSHHRFPYTETEALQYLKKQNSSNNALVLAIILKEGNKHIGNISLQSINWIYRTAELAILLGDKTEWKKGLSFEACSLIVNHGFSELNLNRIYCATFDSNYGMSKLAINLGMQQEGRQRQAAYKNGKFLDVLYFGILAKEFYSESNKAHKLITQKVLA